MNREHIREIAIVSLRPKMCIGAGVDELGVDPDTVVDSLDTAFEDVGDPQLLTDLAQVAFPNRLVLHHAGAADYFEVRDFRQIQ